MILPADGSDSSEQVTGQLRGGSLLLVSRVFAVGVNMLTQIIIVRWLSPGDYGALAYVLSLTWVARNMSTLGMNRVLPRLIPMYHERGDYPRLFGALVLQSGSIIVIGLILWLVLLIGAGSGLSFGQEEPRRTLLVILALIVPLEALDYFLFEVLLAAFHRPRSIALRKHVIGPTIKLSVVLVMIWLGASLYFLAIGLVVAAAIGIAVYISAVVRIFRELGLTAHFPGGVRVPWEALAMGIPLLTTTLMFASRHSLDAIVVGTHFGDIGVAQLRAVYPAATLNELVTLNFAVLFMPLASRLIARRAYADLDEAYWRTAAWQTVLTLPIFLLTFSMATLTTTTLFGEEYRGSAAILAILSVGIFFTAVLGPSNLVLLATGSVRYLVFGNLWITALNVILLLMLVPRFGAVGAAIATVTGQVVQRLYEHLGLRRTAVRLVRRGNAALVLTAGLAALLVFATSNWLELEAVASAATAGVAVLLTIRINRDCLAVAQTFPEAARIPGARHLFGRAPTTGTSAGRSETDQQ